MSSPAYVIRTATGFIGRRTVTGPLRSDLPRDFAYTYDTADEANAVAQGFDGAAVETL